MGLKVKIKLHFPTSVMLESVGEILRVEQARTEQTLGTSLADF